MATETARPNALEKDHNLVADAARAAVSQRVHYEKRPVKGFDGRPVEGLYTAWIVLDNPTQYNSYTTDMVKGDDSRFPRREQRPRRGRGRVHR